MHAKDRNVARPTEGYKSNGKGAKNFPASLETPLPCSAKCGAAGYKMDSIAPEVEVEFDPGAPKRSTGVEAVSLGYCGISSEDCKVVASAPAAARGPSGRGLACANFFQKRSEILSSARLLHSNIEDLGVPSSHCLTSCD
ncbi:T Cell Receptor Beta Variable 27 [Manis pentadactyla]|nr:T Cell Receptor Beta Variable 27 [Manis pentadactyla]